MNIENLAKQILKEDVSEKEEKEADLGAVQTALTRLLGSDPSEEDKISPQELETIIRLDEFPRCLFTQSPGHHIDILVLVVHLLELHDE